MHKVIEKKSGEIKLEITVSADSLKKVTELVVADLGSSLKIAGFRPGKAPQMIVEREVGKDRFWAEVVDKAVPEAYFEAVVKEKVSPISQPKVTMKSFVPGQSLVFEALVAIVPEIKDLKYKNFNIKPEKAKITEKEKTDALENIAKKVSERKEVERSAKSGDQVEIDFDGKMKGIPFDGGKSQNHPLVLGSNSFVPGFEEKIIGHKKGDEFTIDLTFPEDYHAKHLAGQKVTFDIKLNLVFEVVVPKVDDELAKKFGFPDLKKLKEEVEKELIFAKEVEIKRGLEEKIIDLVITKNKLEAPTVLVDEQVHQMVHEAEHNLSHSGMTLEGFLEMSKKTLEEIQIEMRPEAEKRVKIGLVLGEISKLEKIEVKEKEVDAEIDKLIQTASPEVSREDLRASYDTPEKRRELSNSLVIRKTLDRLLELNVKA